MYASVAYISLSGLGGLAYNVIDRTDLRFEEVTASGETFTALRGEIYATIANPAIDVSSLNGTDQTLTIDLTGDFYDLLEFGDHSIQDDHWTMVDVRPDGYKYASSTYSTSLNISNHSSFVRVESINRINLGSTVISYPGYFLRARLSIPLRGSSGNIELIGRHNAIVHYGNNAEHITRASGGIWYGTGGGSVQKMQLEQGNFGYLWINGQKRRVKLNAQTLGFYE